MARTSEADGRARFVTSLADVGLRVALTTERSGQIARAGKKVAEIEFRGKSVWIRFTEWIDRVIAPGTTISMPLVASLGFLARVKPVVEMQTPEPSTSRATATKTGKRPHGLKKAQAPIYVDLATYARWISGGGHAPRLRREAKKDATTFAFSPSTGALIALVAGSSYRTRAAPRLSVKGLHLSDIPPHPLKNQDLH